MIDGPSAGHYLITWWESRGPLPQSYVAAYRSDGTQTVLRTHITDSTDGQLAPDIACDFGNNRCLVVGSSWGIVFPLGGTWGRYIDANTGKPPGTSVTWFSGGARAEDIQIAFSPASHNYFVTWVHNRVAILGRRVPASLETPPDARSSSTLSKGQASMRYNAGTDSFMLASRTTAADRGSWRSTIWAFRRRVSCSRHRLRLRTAT